MYHIYQGGNAPIHIRFQKDASTFTYISAGLYTNNNFDYGTEIKHWDKANMTINNTDVYLPLTQAETKAFQPINTVLLIKYRINANSVEFVNAIPIEIVTRYDKTITLGAN